MGVKKYFSVDANLKNILGKELITDKMIGIYELVKNSYDANASNVIIRFDNLKTNYASIKIIDNGIGMTALDIESKWLRVAYSEKREKHNDKRKFAGSKGIGRLACDRLGEQLILTTKTINDVQFNELAINWNFFENNSKVDFINIPVEFNFVNKSEFINNNGTVIEIQDLRDEWNREDLLNLKKSLKKLVNPKGYHSDNSDFIIEIICNDEKKTDDKETDDKKIVNGKIENDIFEKLNIKTIHLNVKIQRDFIFTQLYDRNSFLFKIREDNLDSKDLNETEIDLFFLNRSAKTTFTTAMGYRPSVYGSIFIYKNNFRVLPYGEPNSDFFNIDMRKAQGYNRFLGTRDLLGRISISNSVPLYETSSRDGGFIKNKALKTLEECFYKYLKVLEKYVLSVKFGEPFSKGKVIVPEESGASIVGQIVGLIKDSSNPKIEYNDDIFKIIDEGSQNSLKKNIDILKKNASKKDDFELLDVAIKLENQFNEYVENMAELEDEIANIEIVKKDLNLKVETEQKKAFFLKDVLTTDQKDFSRKIHNILLNIQNIQSVIILLHQSIENEKINKEIVLDSIYQINHSCERIKANSNYGGIAEFGNENETVNGDLGVFIKQYVEKVFKNKPIKIIVDNDIEKKEGRFSPQDIASILENIVSNSIKARADKLIFRIYRTGQFVEIEAKDNGYGLTKHVRKNIDKLFDFNVSFSDGGTGIGLFHIKEIIEKMNGTIKINEEIESGFEILMKVKI